MVIMNNFKQLAQEFINQIAAGDYAGASGHFDANLARLFSEETLKAAWLQLLGQAGAFQEQTGSQSFEKTETTVVTVTCRFEKMFIDMRVSFSSNGQISGLTYMPTPNATPYQPPAYVDSAAFHDVEITVGSGEWALPASLSLPEGSGPFPAVVLVHGSGPQDRDETLGPNKPFRDLAWGLASQGIAVLRYEKRTKAHAAKYTPELIAQITVQDEVIDDALSAVRLLRGTPQVDPDRIYVLGHSMGATLAPRIGQQDPAIAGLIIMAGMTRPFEDTILDQFTYLASLSGTLSVAQKADLEQMKVKVDRVKDLNLSAQVPAKDLPLDIHPAYWLSLRGYHPAEVAASLNMRLFVLQAGRDYQVTLAGDYPAWQEALGTKPNVTLKVYPRLCHMFIAGEGPSTPQEYIVEGHVEPDVVHDVAEWIKS